MRFLFASFLAACAAACASSSAADLSQAEPALEATAVNATPEACDALADRTMDLCVPDDDAPVPWESCLASLDGKDQKPLASACCASVAADFLWCPKASASTCDTLESWAMDNCVPDDDAAVDWKTCFAIGEVGAESLANACCDTSDGFLWCKR